MKSGLGDRNNGVSPLPALPDDPVSMKSGLGDRNNSSTTDGMVWMSFHFDLAGDGTVNFTKIDQWSATAGRPFVMPGAEWLASHEGKVTGWSGDLPEVVSSKKTLKPASELYETVGFCKVAFNFSLTTTEGVENSLAVLKLRGKQSKAELEIGNGVVLVEDKES